MKKKTSRLILTLALVLALAFSTVLFACEEKKPPVDEGVVVTLDYNDDVSRPMQVLLPEGGLAKPNVPARTGYSFTKWTDAKEGGSEITFPFNPTENKTIYAQWEPGKYNVYFDWNFEGAPEPTKVEKQYNTLLTAEEIPTKEDVPAGNEAQQFLYFTATKDSEKEVDFTKTYIKKDTTFYAFYIGADQQRFTVKYFDDLTDDEAHLVKTDTVIEGRTTFAPTVTNPGKRLIGWTTDKTDTEGKKAVTFPYTPTAHTNLYAAWKTENYTIDFMYNYTGAPDQPFKTITAEGGKPITPPETDPEREGWNFLGWYPTASGGTKVDFATTIATKTTQYYAHWGKEGVVTNIFDAEFVYIDPDAQQPGYSGATNNGYGMIIGDEGLGATTQHEPGSAFAGKGYYMSYLYAEGTTLKFVINSSAACTATLYVSAGLENICGSSDTFRPTGDRGYSIVVNGVELEYGSINVTNSFKETSLGTINLKEGENVIELITNNSSKAYGGTTQATAPIIDYIRLDTKDASTLSWSPEYDNLSKM